MQAQQKAARPCLNNLASEGSEEFGGNSRRLPIMEESKLSGFSLSRRPVLESRMVRCVHDMPPEPVFVGDGVEELECFV